MTRRVSSSSGRRMASSGCATLDDAPCGRSLALPRLEPGRACARGSLAPPRQRPCMRALCYTRSTPPSIVSRVALAAVSYPSWVVISQNVLVAVTTVLAVSRGWSAIVRGQARRAAASASTPKWTWSGCAQRRLRLAAATIQHSLTSPQTILDAALVAVHATGEITKDGRVPGVASYNASIAHCSAA
jgi:hypothetical protein